MRAALVDIATDQVVNVIELPDDYDPDREGAYIPEETHTIIPDDEGKAIVNGYFRDNTWVEPEPLPPPPPSPQEQFDALADLLISRGLVTEKDIDKIKAGPVT